MKKSYTLEEIEKIIDENERGVNKNKDENEDIIKILDEKKYIAKILEEYLEKDNQNIKLMLLLAKVYNSIPQSEEAIRILKKVVKLDAYDDKNWFYLSYSYYCIGEHKKALINIKKAIGINDNDYIYFYILGFIYTCMSKHNDAFYNYQKAPNINNTSISSEVLSYGDNLILKTCLKLKKHKHAVDFLKRLINIHNNDETLCVLGKAYLENEEYENSIKCFNEILERNNKSYFYCMHSAFDSLIIAYTKIKEYRKPVELYKKYIKEDTSIAYRFCKFTTGFKEIDNYEYCIKAYNELIEEEPHNIVYYDGLSGVYEFIFDLNKAIEVCEDCINKNNNLDYDFYYDLGFLYYRIRQYDKAIEYYIKAVNIMDADNNNNRIFLNIADIYCYKMNKFNDALEYYNKAIHLDDEDIIPCYEGMIYVLSKLSRFEERDILISKIIELYKKESMEYYLEEIADLYAKIDEDEKVLSYYKKYSI